MRSVNITGKHNIDEINKIGNREHKPVRKHMKDLDEPYVDYTKQLDLIREVYMDYGTINNISEIINTDSVIKVQLVSELNTKLQGYKGQDIRKDIYNATLLITMEDILEKLLGSKLKCYYCTKHVLVLYKNVRYPYQWTLDRINNNLGHTKDNTCISCLKCNLQRRLMDVKKFDFTKKLVISKVLGESIDKEYIQ